MDDDSSDDLRLTVSAEGAGRGTLILTHADVRLVVSSSYFGESTIILPLAGISHISHGWKRRPLLLLLAVVLSLAAVEFTVRGVSPSLNAPIWLIPLAFFLHFHFRRPCVLVISAATNSIRVIPDDPDAAQDFAERVVEVAVADSA